MFHCHPACNLMRKCLKVIFIRGAIIRVFLHGVFLPWDVLFEMTTCFLILEDRTEGLSHQASLIPLWICVFFTLFSHITGACSCSCRRVTVSGHPVTSCAKVIKLSPAKIKTFSFSCTNATLSIHWACRADAAAYRIQPRTLVFLQVCVSDSGCSCLCTAGLRCHDHVCSFIWCFSNWHGMI